MPRKHYEGSHATETHQVLLAHECRVFYAVLREEVNQIRREAGLPERTLDDITTARLQVIARLQGAQMGRGEA